MTYYGAEDAEEVIVTMGSVAQTIEQTVDYYKNKEEKLAFLMSIFIGHFQLKHFSKNTTIS